jgi:hypothetical protein
VVRLTVCRGCCCGTPKARPDVDHDAQLARIVALADVGAASWRRSECLGPCEEANVIVVQPSPGARAGGARPVWLGRLGDGELDELVGWVRRGGPGRSTMPKALEKHVITTRPGRPAPPAPAVSVARGRPADEREVRA